jgi:hypothetical protein
MKEKPRLYVIKKYVTAMTATEAIRISKDIPVHEVELFRDWDEDEDELEIK